VRLVSQDGIIISVAGDGSCAFSGDGGPDFMASMVLGSQTYEKLSVFFDNTGGNSTGMGVLTSKICSSFCSPLQLRVVVMGLDNAVISQRTISQNPGTLYWMNLAVDFPETAGITGTFVVEPVQSVIWTRRAFRPHSPSHGAFTVTTPVAHSPARPAAGAALDAISRRRSFPSSAAATGHYHRMIDRGLFFVAGADADIRERREVSSWPHHRISGDGVRRSCIASTTLFAAMNTLDGTVISMCDDQNRHQEWLKFLLVIDQVTPSSQEIHLLADNYATHKHQNSECRRK
jgi:hypothetical protein